MKFSAQKRTFFIALLVLLPAISAMAAIPCDGIFNVVYCQPWDQTGNAYSSQNDTGGGNGHFSTVYDNFKLNSGGSVRGIYWVGEYFNPPQQGQITAWHIEFYNDNGGQPGTLAQAYAINGNGNETFLGNYAGFPTYEYNEDNLSFSTNAGTTYWVAVYPDLAFPPQWGWSSGTGGDGISYQDFFGSRSQLAADMAMAIQGGNCCGVPEPGTLVMVGTGVVSTAVLGTDVFGFGLLGLIGAIRRRLL